jgi:hypothetical protein
MTRLCPGAGYGVASTMKNVVAVASVCTLSHPCHPRHPRFNFPIR